MKNESKKKLVKLTVVSFTTALERDEQKNLKGGSVDASATNGTTSIPIFCR